MSILDVVRGLGDFHLTQAHQMSREGSSIQDGCLEPFWGIAVDRRRLLAGSSFTVLVSLMPSVAWSAPYPTVQDVRLIKIIDRVHAPLSLNGRSGNLKRGEAKGGWTLVELIDGDNPFVVLENFDDLYAPMFLVDRTGIRTQFSKTAESTAQDIPNAYFGHRWKELTESPTDLLGREVLKQPGDPRYDLAASAFPPIRQLWGDT